MDEVQTERPLRADARRNRARVLEAAREAFATEGLAVPLDEIARRAGVGAGTVYRHFPTKEALFEAVLTDRLEHLVSTAKKAQEAADPGEAFYEFLAYVVSDADTKKDLADALAGSGVDLSADTWQAAADLKREIEKLLAKAQEEKAVRDDVDAEDVHAVVRAAFSGERQLADGYQPGRLTSLILDALRPR